MIEEPRRALGHEESSSTAPGEATMFICIAARRLWSSWRAFFRAAHYGRNRRIQNRCQFIQQPHHSCPVPEPLAHQGRFSNSEGAILAAIALLISRTIRGKIVDYIGIGIPGVTVVARHHEPRNRIPRVLRNESSSSDESGEFVLCNVGLDVARYVDSLAPSYPRSHSTRLTLEVDETWIGRIGPKEPQATVVVKVVDRSGQPLAGVPTFLCAETSHFIPWARSPWLIRQGLTPSLLASRFGSARFTGVPPGAFTIGAKPATISLERAVVAVAIQEVSITLVDPR